MARDGAGLAMALQLLLAGGSVSKPTGMRCSGSPSGARGGRLRTRQEELGRGGVGLLRRKAAAWRPIWSKEAEADDGDGHQRRTPRVAALQFSMASMWFPVRERQGMRERGGKRDGKEGGARDGRVRAVLI